MNAALYDSVLSGLSNGFEKEELSKLCTTYPYFATAQYILLKQEKADTEQWLTQGQKAALFFSPQLLTLSDENLIRKELPKTIEAEIITKDGEDEIYKQEEPEVNSTELPGDDNGMIDSENTPASVPEQVFENRDEDVSVISSNDVEELKDAVSKPPLSIKPIKEGQLLFEPLHTSDYFASQGIKISHIVDPTDKLGKQLKSFTGWLQTMKQVHPEKAITITLDKNVEALAEKSNKEDEVLTEAMAEACLNQGKKEKAHEIYQKLSLLNPTKSSYFAAKINELQ